MNNVNLLSTYQLVTLDDDLFAVQPTRKKHSTRLQLAYQLVVIFRACSSATGRLMARYCVAFETMKNFYDIQGDDNIQTLVRNHNLGMVQQIKECYVSVGEDLQKSRV